MKALRSLGRFWYDFVIGDDWKIAVAVVTALVSTAAAWAGGLLTDSTVPPAGAVLLFILFTTSVVIDVHQHARRRRLPDRTPQPDAPDQDDVR